MKAVAPLCWKSVCVSGFVDWTWPFSLFIQHHLDVECWWLNQAVNTPRTYTLFRLACEFMSKHRSSIMQYCSLSRSVWDVSDWEEETESIYASIVRESSRNVMLEWNLTELCRHLASLLRIVTVLTHPTVKASGGSGQPLRVRDRATAASRRHNQDVLFHAPDWFATWDMNQRWDLMFKHVNSLGSNLPFTCSQPQPAHAWLV